MFTHSTDYNGVSFTTTRWKTNILQNICLFYFQHEFRVGKQSVQHLDVSDRDRGPGRPAEHQIEGHAKGHRFKVTGEWVCLRV